MAAAGPRCGLSRQELDAYLRESGYGSNAAMFACYFTRAEPNGPPLCINCKQSLANHAAAASASVGMPMESAVAGAPALASVVGGAAEPSLPKGLHTGYGEDTIEIPPPRGVYVPLAILFAVALVMLMVFKMAGLLDMAPVVAMSPCIMLVVALILSATIVKYRTTIENDEATPPAERMIRCEKTRLVLACCGPRVKEASWGSIQRIESESTSASVNKQSLFRVVAYCDTGAQLTLFQGFFEEAEREVVNWRHYFREVLALRR